MTPKQSFILDQIVLLIDTLTNNSPEIKYVIDYDDKIKFELEIVIPKEILSPELVEMLRKARQEGSTSSPYKPLKVSKKK